MLSNDRTDFIGSISREIPDFTIEYNGAKRPIDSNVAGRGKITEVLVRNW